MHPLAPVDDATRRARLAQAIQTEIVAGGVLESQTDFNAVIRFGRTQTNHILHLILTLITCLVWGLVWIALTIIHKSQNKTVMLAVDEYGQVLRQEIKA